MVRIDSVVALDNLSPAWAWGGATGKDVRVAIVDSGIDADHPSLRDCVDSSSCVTFESQPDGAQVPIVGPHRDAYGHGTACASIIHALAPEATIVSIKVLGENNTGSAAKLIAGIEYAVANGFDVINLSLGCRKRDVALELYELCDRAYFGNSFVVTAANNVMRQSYPSLFASVASVACNTTSDQFRFHYNPDPPTEFLARGINVPVAWLDGATIESTGNSFAAPHISGLAALVKSKHRELRPFQLKTVLWACAANVSEAKDAAAGRLSRQIRLTRATRMATRIAPNPSV